MKIVISAASPTLDAAVDPRFGRAAWLLLIDSNTMTLIEAIDNSAGVGASHGAGIQAAALTAEKGAEAVLTGRVGPKAMPVLERAGIRIIDGIHGTVREAISAALGQQTGMPTQAGTQTTDPSPAQGQRPGQGQGQGRGQGCGCGGGQGGGQGAGQGKGMGQGRGKCRN